MVCVDRKQFITETGNVDMVTILHLYRALHNLCNLLDNRKD